MGETQVDRVHRERANGEAVRIASVSVAGRNKEEMMMPNAKEGLSQRRFARANTYEKDDNFYCPLKDNELFEAFVGYHESLRLGGCADFQVTQLDAQGIRAGHGSGVEARQESRSLEEVDVGRFCRAVINRFDHQNLRVIVTFNPRDLERAKEYNRTWSMHASTSRARRALARKP
jgi:hypothetical protein